MHEKPCGTETDSLSISEMSITNGSVSVKLCRFLADGAEPRPVHRALWKPQAIFHNSMVDNPSDLVYTFIVTQFIRRIFYEQAIPALGRCAERGGVMVKHYKELAYMGFIPVLLHLRTIFANMKRCKEDIVAWQPYVNILVAREDNKNAENVKEFLQSYQSSEVAKAAETIFNGGAVPGW